jgi:cell wall assembly regulator SMI1
LGKGKSLRLRDIAPLQKALAELDKYLGEADVEMLKAMRAGISEADVQKLLGEVVGDSPVPLELFVWFGWHNGQDGTSQELSPDRTFTLMELRASVAAWRSLRDLKSSGDLQEPWSLSWIPLMTNGAGDYVVFESSPDAYGTILEYWHADEDRPVLAKNLATFAKDIVRSRKEAAKGPRKLHVDWQLDGATPLTTITNADVFNAPVGTTYFGGPRTDGRYLVCVRVAPYDCWAAKGGATLKETFAEVGKIVEANDGMKFYAVPGAFSMVANLLADKQAAPTAKVTVAKIW